MLTFLTFPHLQDHVTVDNAFTCVLLPFLNCDQFLLPLEMQRQPE